MSSVDNDERWTGDNQAQKERYWEHSLRESRGLLKRQNQAIKEKRDRLADYIQYHFLFLGFIFATGWRLSIGSQPKLIRPENEGSVTTTST
jgi:hypothetical protein